MQRFAPPVAMLSRNSRQQSLQRVGWFCERQPRPRLGYERHRDLISVLARAHRLEVLLNNLARVAVEHHRIEDMAHPRVRVVLVAARQMGAVASRVPLSRARRPAGGDDVFGLRLHAILAYSPRGAWPDKQAQLATLLDYLRCGDGLHGSG